MRHAHGCEPDRAVGGGPSARYCPAMQNQRLARTLRWASLAVIAAGLAVWLAAGARIGWTETSIVTVQRDEITGIDYPVRQPAFRPGVEVPLLATAAAAALATLAWATTARRSAKL